MESSSTPQSAGPARPPSILGFLRRRLIAILIPLLMVPGVALALSLQKQKEYEASTSLLFRDSGIGSSVLASEDPTREAATNLRLLQLGVLDDRVNARLKRPFTGSVDVVTEADSNLATIIVTDTDPGHAARVANIYARQYIALRRQKSREEVNQERRAVLSALASIPPEEQQGSLQEKALQTRLQKLAVAAAAPGGATQVKPAQPPSSASSPDPPRNTVIGAFIGLALGIAFAVWLEQRDRRVRDPHHIEAVFKEPIIGRVPKSKALKNLGASIGPLPPAEAESFRALRANLRHRMERRNAHSTLVTSANPGEGKTTIAWNLARAAALSGAKVLLVEADMRRPVLAIYLGADWSPGLSQLLSEGARLQDLIKPISFWEAYGEPSPAAVDVLFAGPQPSNPAELLGSARMKAALETMSEGYDLVVVDTPASVVSDALPIVDHVGGVVVVGRMGVSTVDSITGLHQQLENLDAKTIGIVVNSDSPNHYASKYYL